MNKSSSDNSGNINTATESLCPKGWTLPSKVQIDNITGGNSGSTTYVSVFNPVLGGNYDNSILIYESTYGFWWGNEFYNNALRHGLFYTDGRLYTSTYYGLRSNGRYIRCVSEEKTVTDLTYLQDMTGEIARTMKIRFLIAMSKSKAIKNLISLFLTFLSGILSMRKIVFYYFY